jgi:ATP-dependent DNA ligase
MTTDNIDQTDLDLDYVRGKRKQVIDTLTEGGLPKNTREMELLLMALSDMDRTALSKKKIKVDKEIGNNQNQAMELIATMFTSTKIKEISLGNYDGTIELPFLNDSVPKPDLIDGETDALSSAAEDYNSFTSRMQGSQ